MPDKDGRLTSTEVEAIATYLNSKGAPRPCPVCGNPHWEIGSHILDGTLFRGGGLVVGGPSMPMFLIVCKNCFYIRHFMAIPAGILT